MGGSLTGGSIRILWGASDAAEVTITGGVSSWTVNGSAVTFPYSLSSSTTFETAHAGTYTVSVEHHGYEIANTPDGTREVELRFGEQEVFEPTVDGGGRGVSQDLMARLSATIATHGGTPPAWAPNTAYGVGQQVLNPSGQVVAAKVAFTSGATYDAINWRASTTLAARGKDVMGGQFPTPLRVPTLTIERMWPNLMHDHRPLWASADGQTVYAVGRDGVFRKSTDGGQIWSQRGLVPATTGGSALGALGRANTFLKLTKAPYADVLLSFRLFETEVPLRIARSTDEGATWTDVDQDGSTLFTTGTPMGVSSWREDPNTGYIYYGEYATDDTLTEVNVYRSTDGGQTWTKWYTFPGPGSASASKVRHIHAVEWDHVSQRIVIMTGDDDPKAGIYRVSADGTTVEPWLTSDQVTNLSSIYGITITNAARAIGFIPFDDYVAFVGDSTANPWLCRVKRTDLALANPPVERVYQLNSTGWFAAKASSDGSRWVFSASQEAGTERLDALSHLYAVEDQGAAVYEVGVLPVTSTGFVTLAPLSTPDSGGDVFYLQDHNSTRRAAYRCRLAYGGGVMMPWPLIENRVPVQVWRTVNAEYVDLPSGGTKLAAVVKVPAGAKYMRLYDMGVKGTTGQTSSLRMRIKSSGGTTFQDTSVISERDAAGGYGGQQEWKEFAMTPGAELHIMLENVDATLNAGGVGFVTFGFGTI